VNDASDYMAHIHSLIISNSKIQHWNILREEIQGNIGLFRYRLRLVNEDIVELFERFEVIGRFVHRTKYSFHWQQATGQLIKRWDNAAHHPEITTHPFHVHDGDEKNVLPSSPMTVIDILVMLEVLLSANRK
jgi:hypothetical protein